MSKVCFVISPMGDEDSLIRKRADYVFDTYIEPACRMAGYLALRADHGVGSNLVKGINTALHNAPMAIAYLGSAQGRTADGEGASHWNANVMIEVGFRLASNDD